MVQFGAAYGLEGGGVDEHHQSYFPEIGDSLLVVGFLTAFRGPLEEVELVGEVTYVLDNLIVETVSFGHGEDCGGTDDWYSVGRLRILADATPDADFLHPATFLDGEVLLEGELSDFQRGVFGCMYEKAHEYALGTVRWVGGIEYARVNEGGVGFTWALDGTCTDKPWELPPSIQEAGYFGEFSLGIWTDRSVQVEPTTWGRIKRAFGID